MNANSFCSISELVFLKSKRVLISRRRLVDGVAHFLAVDLGDDIEGGHGSEGTRAVHR